MCKFLLFGIAFILSMLPAHGAELPSGIDAKIAQIDLEEKELAFDPSLSKAYLVEPKKEIGKPRVIVAHYNLSQGLLAAYQSESGKRILFRARARIGGGMVAQILHLDPTTGKIAHLIGRSKSVDDDGQPVKDVEVAGVNMRAFMKSRSAKSNGYAEKEQHLKQFVADDTGRTLIDAVPALYATLEALETDPEAAKLIAPFGAVAMALQLTTQQFSGFKHADTILGAARAKRLRDDCGSAKDCSIRGKGFMVHRSGLFDALSKHKGAPSFKNEKSSQSSIQSTALGFLTRRPSQELVEQLMYPPSTRESPVMAKSGGGSCDQADMNAACFGLCGPSCFTPGNIAAPQCYGHDYCVCAYSHDQCLLAVPDDCGVSQGIDCSSLWEAVGGWLGGLWDAFWDWLESWFEEDDPCEQGVLCQNG
jgi:hypothetical protein